MNEVSSRARILLVEDSSEQALLVETWLVRHAGYQVITVASCAEAIKALYSQPYDLALIDIELPDGIGIDVALAAKKANAHICTMVMTAHTQFDYALQAMRSQVDEFMVKPLNREQLIDSVHSLLERASMRQNLHRRTILAVGAHPDDVEIGCGGILLRHASLGDRIVILTLTSGESGGDVSTRAQEAQWVAKEMGAELRMENFQDTRLSSGIDTIDVISKTVRELDPNIVYTHSEHDLHQDHRAAHQATLVASRLVTNVLCYQSPSSTTAFCPSLYVDIEELIPRKLRLIEAYASQTAKCSYLQPDLIQATARYWGRFAGYRHVEPLEVVRAMDYRWSRGSSMQPAASASFQGRKVDTSLPCTRALSR